MLFALFDNCYVVAKIGNEKLNDYFLFIKSMSGRSRFYA